MYFLNLERFYTLKSWRGWGWLMDLQNWKLFRDHSLTYSAARGNQNESEILNVWSIGTQLTAIAETLPARIAVNPIAAKSVCDSRL